MKIGFGGGCHWCTEAVFQSLKGVEKVEQGWVASDGEDSNFSEAVIVYFTPEIISLKTLIEVHLHTHSSTSKHSMRKKYRSAVYYYSIDQKREVERIILDLQEEFDYKLITKVLPFVKFKPSPEEYQNYYLKNPNKPFCQRYIHPKLMKISILADYFTVNLL
jgi:peptide-methionine (S)-S-oxide reductase